MRQRRRAAALHGGRVPPSLRPSEVRPGLGLAALRDPLPEPLLAAHQLVGRHAAVLEHELSGV